MTKHFSTMRHLKTLYFSRLSALLVTQVTQFLKIFYIIHTHDISLSVISHVYKVYKYCVTCVTYDLVSLDFTTFFR